jgi:spore maturation protein CgeB
VKLFLLGKRGSVTHWLEDAVHAFGALGHEVETGFVRRPWLPQAVEAALAEPIGADLVRRIGRAAPDLILAIGAFHVPPAILEQVAATPARPPLVGWVGDVFEPGGHAVADLYDLVGYTDTGLFRRHRDRGLRGRSLFLPHAADPSGDWPPAGGGRKQRMVFVANPTPGRRAVVAKVRTSVAIHGPGWRPADGPHHEIHARRAPASALRGIYASHVAALNIRNEHNVLSGLNQRNFDPCLAGAALVTDDQPDLALCFEPGLEVAVWRDTDELNDLYERFLANPTDAAALAGRGRRRVLAHHTYGARLKTLTEHL